MYGLDFLGAPKYADLVIRELPTEWALGVFANTFGDAFPMLEKLLSRRYCPRIRIHGVWDDDHRYTPKVHDPIIQRELFRAVELKTKFPNTDIQYSPFCEHRFTSGQREKVLGQCLSLSRGIQIVNSPERISGAFRHPHVINEIHGTGPALNDQSYNYSFDGTSCVDVDVEAFKERHSCADTFFFWHPSFNGRLNEDDDTARPQRKAWPTSDLIDSIIYLKNEGWDAVLPNRWLMKSHADRHKSPPELRAYKPVWIIPVLAPRVELRASNGQIVSVSGKPEKYKDGRWRYYHAEYGYQIAEKAIRIAGRPGLAVVVNGETIGRVNMAFRAGEFRS